MANKKLNDKKTQRRKEKVKDKLLRRRESQLRAEKVRKEADSAVVDTKEKIVPFVKPETRDAKIKKQLEANLQVLKALEKQYIEEMKAKKETQDSLEGDTIREKIDNAIKSVTEQQNLLDKLNTQKRLLEKINLEMVDVDEFNQTNTSSIAD